jgi:hypothetical protein
MTVEERPVQRDGVPHDVDERTPLYGRSGVKLPFRDVLSKEPASGVQFFASPLKSAHLTPGDSSDATRIQRDQPERCI